MNMSLRDIFLWLVALDFPSISAIWNWLINVPRWPAVLTLYLGWFLTSAVLALTWDACAWLNHRAYNLGQRLRYWYLATLRIFR